MAGASGGEKRASFRHQEAVCGDAKSGMVVKASPTSAFVMPQPEFLFQFLIITFDDPAMLGCPHQFTQGGSFRQCG